MKSTPVCAAMLVVFLTACGKSEPPAPAAEPTAPTAPAPVPQASAPATPAPAPVVAQDVAPPPPAPSPAPAKPAAVPAPSPAPAPAPSKPADLALGQQTYRQACAFCHDKGIANAPMAGVKSAWSARLAQGMDALYASALHGKGGMPAKGGNPALPDDAVKAAVDYLAAQAR